MGCLCLSVQVPQMLFLFLIRMSHTFIRTLVTYSQDSSANAKPQSSQQMVQQ